MIQKFMMCLIVAIAGLPAISQEATERKTLSVPGVLLTFDDAHVLEWVEALPLLEKYGVRATFFVTRFDQLSTEQIEGLHRIQKAGHTIGCHGLRHIKAAEYTDDKGIEAYMAAEITPAIAHMNAAGFHPTAFAYPSSNNNSTTDATLLETFRHLRTGTGIKEGQRYVQTESLFTPLAAVSSRGCLTGKGIDRIGYPGKEEALTQLMEAMERVLTQGELLTLYAHNIAESSTSHHIKPATLEKILAHGNALGIRFYAFDELP